VRGRFLALTVAAIAALAACGRDEPERAEAPGSARALSSDVCTPMTSAGAGRPRFLIPMVGPMQNFISDHGIQNAQAAKLVLTERGWRAGDATVALQVCDEASAEEYSDPRKCKRIARALAANPSVLVVVGPSASVCARAMVPVLNGAAGGPVALLGLGNTYLGLTRAGPGVEQEDPDGLYPSGTRNYLRMAPADDAQAAAAVLAARDAGASRTFALHDGSTYGRGLAAAFEETARRAGLHSVGIAAWDPEASDYRALGARVARSGADTVYLGGLVFNNGARVVRDVRGALGRDAAVLGPDGFNQPTLLVEGAGERAEGMTITLSAAPSQALPPRGRQWAQRFTERWGARPCCYAVHAGQAFELALDALARSEGDRASVLEALRRMRVEEGLLGGFSFDEHGDSTLRGVSLWRIEGGRLHYKRTVQVPDRLLTRR